MTETTTEPTTHNAKDILQEALDTIKATFWIQSSEFTFVEGHHLGHGDYEFVNWDEAEKAIEAKTDEYVFTWDGNVANSQKSGKAKVTGVCSVGALALANVTLYDEPLAPWSNISDRDFDTWKAGAALAMTILFAEEPRWHWQGEQIGSVIADWNDYSERTRDQIIASFETALTSPLLAAEEIYEVVANRGWGIVTSRVYFASEADAQAFIDGESHVRQDMAMEYGDDVELSIRPYVHTSMELADAAS